MSTAPVVVVTPRTPQPERRPGLPYARHYTAGGAGGGAGGGAAPACGCRAAAADQVTAYLDEVTCGNCRRSRAFTAARAEADRIRAEAARARAAARDRRDRELRPSVTPWVCPLCDGDGDGGDGRCLECAGEGFIDDARAAGWRAGGAEPVPAPRPPGVRAVPCVDCRYRPGSQEDEAGQGHPPADQVFWCHQGLPVVRGEYRPILWAGEMPVGSRVCAAWWDVAVMGGPPPQRPARDPDQARDARAAR